MTDQLRDLLRQEHDGGDWRASRAALRVALQGMVIDEIDFDPGEFDTNASVLTLRAYAMHGSKPAVEITLSATKDGSATYPQIAMKVEPWSRVVGQAEERGTKGKELMQAVDSLMTSLGSEPVHYGVLLTKLEEGGITVGGVDPSATLLSALSRSEIIESVAPRSGMFRLKEAHVVEATDDSHS